jgi:hypothetical protein
MKESEEEGDTATVAAPAPAISKIVLPTKPVPAVTQNPKNLIIFSKPKVGKTELLAGLPDCLILDIEHGTDYVAAMKLKVNSVAELKAVGTEIIKAGKPYKFIAVDTITALEEMCLPYAEQIYAKTSMGKNWFTKGKAEYTSLLNLPNGAGYPYLREAFGKVIDYIKTLAPTVILVGHVKDTMIDKNGTEVNAMDLDLTGKIKRITTSNSDAIGYLYRKGNQNILSFKTTDEIACGARPNHLRNQELVVSEMTDQGLVTYWDKVFIK